MSKYAVCFTDLEGNSNIAFVDANTPREAIKKHPKIDLDFDEMPVSLDSIKEWFFDCDCDIAVQQLPVCRDCRFWHVPRCVFWDMVEDEEGFPGPEFGCIHHQEKTDAVRF